MSTEAGNLRERRLPSNRPSSINWHSGHGSGGGVNVRTETPDQTRDRDLAFGATWPTCSAALDTCHHHHQPQLSHSIWTVCASAFPLSLSFPLSLRRVARSESPSNEEKQT